MKDAEGVRGEKDAESIKGRGMLEALEGRRMLGMLEGTDAPAQLPSSQSNPQPLAQAPQRLQQPLVPC